MTTKANLISAIAMLALFSICACKSKVLITVVSPEPKSFCMGIKDVCVKSLTESGHEVRVTDVYRLKMFGRLNRGDFTELNDATYFRPQPEQYYANLKNGTTFVPEIRSERENIIWADVIIYIFPIYNGYIPGMMQSFVERVYSYGFAYGTHDLKGKKGMTIFTADSSKAEFAEYLEQFLFLYGFREQSTKMESYPYYAAYGVNSVDQKVREQYLREIADRMKLID